MDYRVLQTATRSDQHWTHSFTVEEKKKKKEKKAEVIIMDAPAAVRDSSRRIPTVDLFEFVRGASNSPVSCCALHIDRGPGVGILAQATTGWFVAYGVKKKKQPSGGKVQP